MSARTRCHRGGFVCVLLCAGHFLIRGEAFAGDAAALVSVSIPPGTSVKPRTIFTQTWTIENTGTTTWTPTASGYTLNMVGLDSLGAIPLFANSGGTYPPSAVIGSGKSIAPGGQASFSIQFIAPEGTGTYTDSFQMNGTSNFGPTFSVQVKVTQAGPTNHYDRSHAISYANNYAGYVVRDGYFWTNGSGYYFYGTNFAASSQLIAAQPLATAGHHRYVSGAGAYETVFANDTPTSAAAKLRYVYPGEGGQRNNFRADGYFDMDNGLAKDFRSFHEQNLRFEVEAFNVLNSVRFNTLTTNFSSGSFGKYSTLLVNPRQLQFSAKYTF